VVRVVVFFSVVTVVPVPLVLVVVNPDAFLDCVAVAEVPAALRVPLTLLESVGIKLLLAGDTDELLLGL